MSTIQVLQATDADIPQACALETLAYANNVASPVFFPGPFPPDAREQRIAQIINMRKDDPTATFLKAVDQDSGTMLAFAKWHVYETKEALEKAPTRSLRFGEGTNQEACEAFFGGLVRRKKEIVGLRPHMYLHMLHTDPKQEGRGAGSALLKWGTQKADELGLDSYLESSPNAHGFYKKYGFEDVETLVLDLSLYGGPDKKHTAPLMMRQPAMVL